MQRAHAARKKLEILHPLIQCAACFPNPLLLALRMIRISTLPRSLPRPQVPRGC